MELSQVLPFLVLLAIVLSAALTPLVRRLAFAFDVIDRPTGGRKIHKAPTALLGGFATGATLVVCFLLLFQYVDGKELRDLQLIGFIIAILILMAGGILDDKFDIKPWQQLLFPLIASIVIVATGSGIIQVTNPFGPGALSLAWVRPVITLFDFSIPVSLPADIITVVWLLTVTYAIKFLDGLDGLAAGMTVIGGALIAALASSSAYFQPLIAIMAFVVAAAYLGFLPYNRQGSIFLGEAGSTIAGFSLGVLAVISGAKVATAATALAIPLVDIIIVVARRLLRGASPFRGDDTHLHFQLLKAGLSFQTAVRLIWGIALVFGLVALTLQTRGKLFLLAGLVVLISVISYLALMSSRAAPPR